jgi:hypothetical protein
MPHLLRDAGSLLVIVAHIAVAGFCLYGGAIEILTVGGGVAWVFLLGAVVSAGGAWYAAVAFMRRQWRAVAVPFVTGPVLFLLFVVLIAATWSRAGP